MVCRNCSVTDWTSVKSLANPVFCCSASMRAWPISSISLKSSFFRSSSAATSSTITLESSMKATSCTGFCSKCRCWWPAHLTYSLDIFSNFLLVAQSNQFLLLHLKLVNQLVVQTNHFLNIWCHRSSFFVERSCDIGISGSHFADTFPDGNEFSFKCLMSPSHVVQSVDSEHGIQRIDIK